VSATDSNVVALSRRYRYADALIEPGTYDAKLVDAETALFFFGRAPAPRVVLWFQICTIGDAFEAVLPAYYAVRSIKGKPRRRGRFAIGFKSHLARDLAAMLGRRPPLELVPIEDIAVRLLSVKVGTVERDRGQLQIPAGARYSVVQRVLE
jgi:hypothetical protein